MKLNPIRQPSQTLCWSQVQFCYNCNNDKNDHDSRSDAKGGEPEALEVFTEGERTYVFVGLERQSSIVVYEVRRTACAKTNLCRPATSMTAADLIESM